MATAKSRAHYRKYQASPKRRAYRAALNRKARKLGVYGKRRSRGLDLTHRRGGKVTLGPRLANRRDGQRKSVAARKKNGRK